MNDNNERNLNGSPKQIAWANDKEKSVQASKSLDEETKFQGIAQWLAD